jgi:hypothetical protein
MEHIVTIDASPKQLSKLRNGHMVRIKKGTGFNLVVHPGTYHLVSRAFAKNKGIQIALSPEEIESNKSLSPEQHAELQDRQAAFGELPFAGQGIFGKKFDRGVRKAIGKHAQKKIYGDLRQALPGIQAGLDSAIVAGATALSAAQPELAPFLLPGSAVVSSYLNDYLENPGAYQGRSGVKGHPIRSLAEKAAKAKLNEQLNQKLGTNYDYLSRAGLENAASAALQSKLDSSGIMERYAQPAMSAAEHMQIYGYGLGAGFRREVGSISGRGSIASGSYYPPALISQPFSANFQMSHFLPVQYQQFNSGSGLYAGKGLY